MKLLLDEMFPYSIAEQLRSRGHDVVAIGERADRRGARDRDVFALAQSEERALVTDDHHFHAIDVERRARGESHYGLIFTSNRRFPRGQPATIGQLVRALDGFLSADAPGMAGSFTHWLRTAG